MRMCRTSASTAIPAIRRPAAFTYSTRPSGSARPTKSVVASSTAARSRRSSLRLGGSGEEGWDGMLLADLAALHLNGDVLDAQAPDAVLHRLEDRLVGSGILHDDVTAHRDHPARDGPHMEIVQRLHAGKRCDAVVHGRH